MLLSLAALSKPVPTPARTPLSTSLPQLPIPRHSIHCQPTRTPSPSRSFAPTERSALACARHLVPPSIYVTMKAETCTSARTFQRSTSHKVTRWCCALHTQNQSVCTRATAAPRATASPRATVAPRATAARRATAAPKGMASTKSTSKVESAIGGLDPAHSHLAFSPGTLR